MQTRPRAAFPASYFPTAANRSTTRDPAGLLALRRVEHDFALSFVALDHAMRFGGARKRQNARDLRHDFAFGRRR
jgi:hypothetical protein